ncbi:MAG: hypothetical protein ACRC37_02330, partial [Lentisphaeria bacterium]
MNRMRFGALLVNEFNDYGFYLSNRMILAVLESGEMRNLAPMQFGSAKVFARNGVAIRFYN